MNDEQLEKCPFCGCEITVVEEWSEGEWFVLCMVCRAQGPTCETEELARAGWNERPEPQRSRDCPPAPQLCNDCGKQTGGRGVTQGRHTTVGCYYSGPPICESCANLRREQSWSKYLAGERT